MAKKGKRDKRRHGEPAARQAAVHAEQAAPEQAPPAAPLAVPAAPAASGSRTLANALIVAFLLFQVATPLRYYLGGRGPDERFSWRMFSTVRMQRCRVKVIETVGGEEQQLNLQKELQVAWSNMLERYRRPVVDKLLARRCAKVEASSVVFTRSCTDTDGSELPDDVVSLDCKSGKLVVTGGGAQAALDAQEDAP
jgi:hypothetical protein